MLLLQLLSLPSDEVRGLYCRISVYFLSIKKKLQVRFDIPQNVINIYLKNMTIRFLFLFKYL